MNAPLHNHFSTVFIPSLFCPSSLRWGCERVFLTYQHCCMYKQSFCFFILCVRLLFWFLVITAATERKCLLSRIVAFSLPYECVISLCSLWLFFSSHAFFFCSPSRTHSLISFTVFTCGLSLSSYGSLNTITHLPIPCDLSACLCISVFFDSFCEKYTIQIHIAIVFLFFGVSFVVYVRLTCIKRSHTFSSVVYETKWWCFRFALHSNTIFDKHTFLVCAVCFVLYTNKSCRLFFFSFLFSVWSEHSNQNSTNQLSYGQPSGAFYFA